MTRVTRKTLEKRIDQAMKRVPADLVIKNVTLLNVATGETAVTDIAITDDTIVGIYGQYEGKQEIDGTGLTAVPGFIDTHVHVESSLVTPSEFDRMVLPRGTTTVICDPHEMANVMGEAGLQYFLDSARHTVMDLYVQLSSCVPATGLETSGATLEVAELKKFRNHPNTLGLAEFMNLGGVWGKDPNALDKLVAFQGKQIDGHMPGIGGFALNALACCGIRNCHESTGLSEAMEKLRKGVNILIREGSVCKDLKALYGLIEPFKAPRLSFCTDDRKPVDIVKEGHIDHIIRTAIRYGADIATTYRIASLSAAEGFGLRNVGLIAPGYRADIVLVRDLRQCDVTSVIKNGKIVTEESFPDRAPVAAVGYNSVKLNHVTPEMLAVRGDGQETPVIGLIRDQIVTTSEQANLPVDAAGRVLADPENDILKLAVLERHGKNGNIARCFVRGFGIKQGAIASTHGHDSHNITVLGSNDHDMALAVNHVREMQGGFVAAQNGRVIGELALPVAGLMSDLPYEQVAADLTKFRQAVAKLNPAVNDPLLHLAFLSLCVIPTLKLTDKGLVLFDPAKGDEAPVLIDDQRRQPPPARRMGAPGLNSLGLA